MVKYIDKAFAYVTKDRSLLVFEHADHPEAGVQVPAGTMRVGEEVAAAALREAAEETGLRDFALAGDLGWVDFDVRPWGKDEVHRRHFVHLVCLDETPETWEHWEDDPEGEPGARYRFLLRWELVNDLPELIAGHNALVPDLIDSLERRHSAGNPEGPVGEE